MGTKLEKKVSNSPHILNPSLDIENLFTLHFLDAKQKELKSQTDNIASAPVCQSATTAQTVEWASGSCAGSFFVAG